MKKTVLASLLAVAALAPIASYAADSGTITFTGSVIDATCTINGGTTDFTVALPEGVSTTALTADTPTGVTGFQIVLTNCSASVNNARTFFDYGATTNGTTNQVKNGTAGTAKGVEIRVMNDDLTKILVGAPAATQGSKLYAVSGTGAARGATLQYAAGYVSNGTVEAGTVRTTTRYTMQYN